MSEEYRAITIDGKNIKLPEKEVKDIENFIAAYYVRVQERNLRAEKGEYYYTLSMLKYSEKEQRSDIDNRHFQTGNYFQYEEDAINMQNRFELYLKIKRWAELHNDLDTIPKYQIIYDKYDGFDVVEMTFYTIMNIKFTSREIAMECIRLYGDDIKREFWKDDICIN